MILQNNPHVPIVLNEHDQDRERLLSNLLQMELTESAQGYLSRTHRPFPIYYVFRLPDP